MKIGQAKLSGSNTRDGVESSSLPDGPISVKIVSGVKQSGIPDTIKMSEAAGQ